MYRLTASLSAVVLAASSAVSYWLSHPDPARPRATTQRVTAADLGRDRGWLRLHDTSGTAARAGVEEIAPLAAPDRFDGSLHLAVAPGQESRVAHYYTAPVPLATVVASPLSYTTYVDGAHTTTHTAGPALQLPMLCHGTFTTLSFEPQRAKDGAGRRGVVPDVWQRWNAGGTALWRTSHAVAGIGAGADAPLGDFADACDGDTSGVLGLMAGADAAAAPAASGAPRTSASGRAGDDTSARLDAYVDNLTVDGTTYDFAVDGTATAGVTLRRTEAVGTPPELSGVITFHSPADGPRHQGLGARLLIDGSNDPDPGDLEVTLNGRRATVTRTTGGSLTAAGPAGTGELRPGGTVTVPFTVRQLPAATDPAGPATLPAPDGGSMTVDAELLAGGFRSLQGTGVHDSASIGL